LQASSDRIGFTNLLSLLYRKRIKANYQDIETLVSPDIDAEEIYGHLKIIVGACNLVHEAFICKALGKDKYRELVEAFSRDGKGFVSERFEKIA
jgi:hypothetical protein